MQAVRHRHPFLGGVQRRLAGFLTARFEEDFRAVA
jgi:hypothetical protein